MSPASEIISEALRIRRKLLNPGNAVVDRGINLRRHREPPPKMVCLLPKKANVYITIRKPAPAILLEMRINQTRKVAGLIRATALYFRCTDADIKGKDRHWRIVQPRQVAMYLCREVTRRSFVEIGKIFDRDHTTVLYSHRKIKMAVESGDAYYIAATRSIVELFNLNYTPHPLPAEPQQNLAGQLERPQDLQPPRIPVVGQARVGYLVATETERLPDDQDRICHHDHGLPAGQTAA